MCMIDCIFGKDDLDALTASLRRTGIVQIDYLSEKTLLEKQVGRGEPSADFEVSQKLFERVEKTLSPLSRFAKKRSALDSLLDVGEKICFTAKPKHSRELFEYAEKTLSKTEEEVKSLSTERETVLRENEALGKRMLQVLPVSSVILHPGDLKNSERLTTVLGYFRRDPKTQVEKTAVSFRKPLVFETFPNVGRFHPAVFCVLKEDEARLFSTLDAVGFTRVKEYFEASPKECLFILEEKIELNKRRAAEIDLRLGEISSSRRDRLLALREMLANEKQRSKILSNCGRTEKTVFMRLWTPKRSCGEITSLIVKTTFGACHIEVEWNPEDAPTLIENPKYLESFEMLTRLFSMPKYNQIDPTLIIAPTFVLFFGLMLTDFSYGLILALTSVYLHQKYSKISKSVRDLSVILFTCGLSAMLFGVLTGSYFGDLVGTYILGGKPQDIAVLMDPLYGNNSIILLAAVCATGFLHVFTGYLMGALDSIRRRNFRKAVTNYLSWYLFAAGLGVTTLSAGGIIPQSFYHAGIALTFISLALLYTGLGFMFLIDIVGVVGNSLSYARLLALGLTTAGIALATNLLANIALDIPYAGIPLAITVFIAGHLINLLMNTLGGFVHSLRLQYVEFFGTFYEGGGRQFKPFTYEKNYT